jgi:L-2,4-diaminobutyrate decarboxylase
VVFRYRARRHGACRASLEDELNGALRRRLLESGRALIGRTAVALTEGAEPRVCLKLTLLNPTATPSDIDELLSEVLRAGREVERQLEERVA